MMGSLSRTSTLIGDGALGPSLFRMLNLVSRILLRSEKKGIFWFSTLDSSTLRRVLGYTSSTREPSWPPSARGGPCASKESHKDVLPNEENAKLCV